VSGRVATLKPVKGGAFSVTTDDKDMTFTVRGAITFDDGGVDTTFAGTNTTPSTPVTPAPPAPAVTYTVTFDCNGGSAVAPVTAAYGTAVPDPGDPSPGPAQVYVKAFDGWHTEAAGGSPIVWPLTLTENTTVYAHWTEYAVGDAGPGGGVIYYEDESDEYPEWRFLEITAENVSDGDVYWGSPYGTVTDTTNGTATASLGTGRTNTETLYAAGHNGAGSPVGLCKNYTGGGLTDWFLPSYAELMVLRDAGDELKSAANFTAGYYWSSSSGKWGYLSGILIVGTTYPSWEYIGDTPYPVRAARAW
jgi:uncharacterized repeat protein (TIGR02543 family)